MMSTWCLKHVEAWNKLIVKQKCCASSWLITEINSSCCFQSTHFCLIHLRFSFPLQSHLDLSSLHSVPLWTKFCLHFSSLSYVLYVLHVLPSFIWIFSMSIFRENKVRSLSYAAFWGVLFVSFIQIEYTLQHFLRSSKTIRSYHYYV